MPDNVILKAARTDLRSAVFLCCVLLVVSGAVLGLNWKYVLNFATGPQPFSASLAASPGAREFVTARGALVPTGWAQQTTVKLLRGLVSSESTSAEYLAMRIEDRLLVVKVPPDFSGEEVSGRLVPLPATIQAAIGESLSPYPWMIDGSIGYRWSFNLFVMLAGPIFTLSLPLLLFFLWRSANVERHPMIARLATLGPPLEVTRTLDGEWAAATASDRAGGVAVTPTAVIALEPVLVIAPIRDLLNATIKVTTTNSGPRHDLLLSLRGRATPDAITMERVHAMKVLDRIAHHAPKVVTAPAA